mmetsp:Transcript_1126/g.2521  ORF Transcript_1126/g.2521 Transcript_1126/m.2521 type:complete len:273 (-) Transcript_1126:17-835(-)
MDAEGEETSPEHPGHETARGCSDVEPDNAAFSDFKPIPAPDVIQKVQFHEQPPMWLMFDFMTSEEIDYLLAKAEPKWERAQVHRAVIRDPAKYRSYVGGSSGKTSDVDTPFTATVGESRTAFMCVLGMPDPIVDRIQARVSAVTGFPPEHVEALNMARYEPGQYFKEHHDGSFRPVTVFVYLSDLAEDDEGGETVFPYIGKAIRPRKGMAVMWNNRKPSGEEDELMRHEAQAPTKSIKFGLNCFVNEKPRQVVYVTKTGEILGSGPAGRYAA